MHGRLLTPLTVLTGIEPLWLAGCHPVLLSDKVWALTIFETADGVVRLCLFPTLWSLEHLLAIRSPQLAFGGDESVETALNGWNSLGLIKYMKGPVEASLRISHWTEINKDEQERGGETEIDRQRERRGRKREREQLKGTSIRSCYACGKLVPPIVGIKKKGKREENGKRYMYSYRSILQLWMKNTNCFSSWKICHIRFLALLLFLCFYLFIYLFISFFLYKVNLHLRINVQYVFI